MKRLIHRYLNENFYLKNGFVYKLNEPDDAYFHIGVMSISLALELNQVFGLARKQLKWYIKSWITSKSKNFNFKAYWFNNGIIIQGNLKTGYVYAPYIMSIDPVVIENHNFQPRYSVSSRYATATVDQRIFGSITLNDNVDE